MHFIKFAIIVIAIVQPHSTQQRYDDYGVDYYETDPCAEGATVTGLFGMIESPSPHPDMMCSWRISTAENTKIAVKFDQNFHVAAYSNGSCMDTINFEESSVPGEMLCGSDIPKSFLSDTNEIDLFFKTATTIGDVDSVFSFTWNAVETSSVPAPVQATLADLQGNLPSPEYPENYPNLVDYTWQLSMPDGKYVFLTSERFNVEAPNLIQTSHCPYDTVMFSTENPTSIESQCGNAMMPMIFKTNVVTINFKSDINVTGSGFMIDYEAVDPITCSEPESITGTSGTITSPYHPAPYDNHLNCIWHITAPENKLIAVRFGDTFEINGGTYCAEEYLQIFDGPMTSSQQYQQNFCSENPPHGFLSSSNELTVVFVSGDSGPNGRGFSVNWETEDACASDQFRCWEGECISEVQKCNGIVDCPNDIADEATCGGEYGPEDCGIQSVAPVFQWDQRIVGGYDVQQGSWPWQVGLHFINNDGDAIFQCGGTLVADRWVLTAAHCIWQSLKGYDWVAYLGDHNITDNDTTREQRIPVEEFYVHPDYYLTSTGVQINDIAMLRLKNEVSRTAWVQPACLPTVENSYPDAGENVIVTGWGRTSFTDDRDVEIMRQVQNHVVNDAECRKKFNAEDHSIDAPDTLICLGSESSIGISACQRDSGGPLVQLVNGRWVAIGVVSFGYQCGLNQRNISDWYTRVSSFLPYIQQYLNGPPNQQSEVAVITEETGTLSFPAPGEVKYPQNVFRQWFIKTTENTLLTVRFISSFNIESGQLGKCQFDYLKIYNGQNTAAPLYENRKLCGSKAPPDFQSLTNSLVVEFSSDNSFEESGFSFSWTTASDESSECPALTTQDSDSGEVEPPQIGEQYAANLNCFWLLRGPENTVLNITFEYFDVESGSNCGFDKLKIYDGNSEDARMYLDRPICGQNRSIPGFESNGNEVLVNFISDDSIAYRGFKIVWKAVADCNSNEFRCWDGSCIDNSLKCNRQPDCPNKRDEIECSHPYGVCGQQQIAPNFVWSPRIVGGSYAVSGSWPWQIFLARNVGMYCGGSIIDTKWILTAAHCILGGPIDVGVGAHNLTDTASIRMIRVKKSYVHENYRTDDISYGYDIALLELSEHIVYADNIQPICIPMASDAELLQVNEECIVTGWGRTRYQGPTSNILRQARVPIVDQDSCKKSIDDYNRDILFCAGYYDTGGIDACQGDSGGPLVCYIDDTLYQFGVISFGDGCAEPRSPGYYTKLTSFAEWIRNITGDLPTNADVTTATTYSTTRGSPTSTFVTVDTGTPATNSTVTTTPNVTLSSPDATSTVTPPTPSATARITSPRPDVTTSSSKTVSFCFSHLLFLYILQIIGSSFLSGGLMFCFS